MALRSRGGDLVGYTALSPAGRARARTWLGGRAAADLTALVEMSPQLYLVAVPDQALPEVAAGLGAALGKGDRHVQPVVAHTSGATSVTVLRPCEETGALTAVFHPLQTFTEPISGSTRFAGAAIAVTPSSGGEDAPAARLCFGLARALGARPFLLADEKRSLYHAAATFACNYLVTLEHHAKRLFSAAGVPDDEALQLFLPLVRTTLENIARQGTLAALTGPLSRGDEKTIAAHLGALEAHAPDLLPVYRALGTATLALVAARGELGEPSLAALAELLQIPFQGTALPEAAT